MRGGGLCGIVFHAFLGGAQIGLQVVFFELGQLQVFRFDLFDLGDLLFELGHLLPGVFLVDAGKFLFGVGQFFRGSAALFFGFGGLVGGGLAVFAGDGVLIAGFEGAEAGAGGASDTALRRRSARTRAFSSGSRKRTCFGGQNRTLPLPTQLPSLSRSS